MRCNYECSEGDEIGSMTHGSDVKCTSIFTNEMSERPLAVYQWMIFFQLSFNNVGTIQRRSLSTAQCANLKYAREGLWDMSQHSAPTIRTPLGCGRSYATIRPWHDIVIVAAIPIEGAGKCRKSANSKGGRQRVSVIAEDI